MGCEKSKTLPQDNVIHPADKNANQTTRGRKSLENYKFTDAQIDIIQSTWPLISRDIVGNGTSVFLDIFTTEPEVKKLFPFKDIDQEDLVNNTLFKIHASSFMQAVDVVCSALPTIEKDCPVSRRLIILGAQHATVPGFDLVYFSIFAKCLHMTWEKVLKEEYTAEVKEAWTNLFDFVMDRISDGYVLYNQEEQTAEKTKLEKELEGQVGNGYDVSVRN